MPGMFFALYFSTSSVVWSTTVRRLTTYTSLRGILPGWVARAISQTAITDVLPSPVGRLHDGGMSPATKRSYRARCHGNGELPVSALNIVSKSISFIGDLHITTTTPGTVPARPKLLASSTLAKSPPCVTRNPPHAEIFLE